MQCMLLKRVARPLVKHRLDFDGVDDIPFHCVAMAPEKVVLVDILAEESTEEAKIYAILELGNDIIEWDVTSGIKPLRGVLKPLQIVEN